MAVHQVHDAEHAGFASKAQEVLSKFNNLDIQLLCSLSRDKTIHSAEQLGEEITDTSPSENMQEVINAAEQALAADDISDLMRIVETKTHSHNPLFQDGETALGDPEQPVGEVPFLFEAISPSSPENDAGQDAFLDLVLAVCFSDFLKKREQNMSFLG